MNEKKIDLSQLSFEQRPSENVVAENRWRRWGRRYALLFGILFGFVGLLLAASSQHPFSKRSVTVVPVLVKRGETQQAGTTLFQAAGWIEPRPTAVRVTALSSGVINELLVVEGQNVEKGEAIARLVTVDAELAVEQSEANLAIRDGELERAKAERKAAKGRLETPVHLEVPLADAKSLLAKAKTEYEKLPFLINSAQANVEYTQISLENKQKAQAAIAGIVIEQANQKHAVAVSLLNELKNRKPNLKREVDELQGKVSALAKQLELLIEEKRQFEEATAKVASAIAIRNEALLKLRKDKLNLERTVVRAPITGNVLRLIAYPGSRVSGLSPNAGHNSSTVIEMYDPTRLQVRVDVRLENVPLVTPGASVKIETASAGKLIEGRVLQSTNSANIQKNTLEVKVELFNPPTTVSPEMLVTATFLAPKLPGTVSEETHQERLLVPKQLIHTGDVGKYVWIVDSKNQAVRKEITTGELFQDNLVEITGGLNVTDKVISSEHSELTSGEKVSISNEDQTLGIGR